MFIRDDGGRYAELADLVEGILARCDDDAACIAIALDSLDADIRNEILSSDLLNAWQVFWYFFRIYPGDEAVEFLVFHPAGELGHGVPMGEMNVFVLTFFVINEEPAIRIEDDLTEVARFHGSTAWTDTLNYIEKDG